MQSGAINEALSDIWGEFVDLTTGKGNDGDSVRWLVAEDLKDTGLRNMKDPAAAPFFDPDRVGSPLYRCGGQTDNGGVHSNSGIANKIASLLVNGGTFNGFTVFPVGMDKTARLFYEVQSNWLTSASDYNDLHDTMNAACMIMTALPADGLTSLDCEQVRRGLDATETYRPEPCDARDEAPECPAGQTPVPLFLDDFEAGCANWTWDPAERYHNGWHCPDESYATSGSRNLWADTRNEDVGQYFMAMNRSVLLPPGRSYMRFRDAHCFEYLASRNMDGGQVEYSTDEGLSWNDAGGLFDQAGYNGVVGTCCGNPIGGMAAFTGESNGYSASRLDLSALAGQRVRLRFRIGTDDGSDIFLDDRGWFIDDVGYTCSGPRVPDISSLSPSSAVAGEGGFILTVMGSDFSPASVVHWNGQPRSTENDDTGQVLKARILASDLASEGIAEVSVVDDVPGGERSHSVRFAIDPPCPPPTPIDRKVRGTLESMDCRLPWAPRPNTDIYTFSGAQGERINLKLSSSAFDPVLVVLGPGLGPADRWASDWCGRDPWNACVRIASLPATGQYTIYATAYDQFGKGGYALRLGRGR